ncbi:hypothetical protein KFE25_005041 [Diacronema lutheri]|uniref:Uncharacterized protein n=1 Tax=Diacronema lutheri TaxID=2081491 RepID=A0A8J6C2W6_DIALT|nr:hypothetical protein KFE25_005041 [Diacronema lutheri]
MATRGFELEQATKPVENSGMFPLELHTPAAVVRAPRGGGLARTRARPGGGASLLLRSLCGHAPPFHLPSPDPVQNLLVNSVAGATPRWSSVGDALLAPVAVLLEGIAVRWMDRVAAPYGRRLWRQPQPGAGGSPGR